MLGNSKDLVPSAKDDQQQEIRNKKTNTHQTENNKQRINDETARKWAMTSIGIAILGPQVYARPFVINVSKWFVQWQCIANTQWVDCASLLSAAFLFPFFDWKLSITCVHTLLSPNPHSFYFSSISSDTDSRLQNNLLHHSLCLI